MEFDSGSLKSAFDGGVWRRHTVPGKNRVLLREPERCPGCGRQFKSLYPLYSCTDHDGLDMI